MTQTIAADRADFYRRMADHNLAPLWEVMQNLISKTPASACEATIWHYDTVRPYVLESGPIISAKEAIRRVLVLENPGLRGSSRITTSLYAGLQLILPGEIAPAHRHSQSALRFIVEGSGAYTAVDGERTIMSEGDFVVTPNWAWHDHGNESDEPMVWLDGLDIPIVQLFDAGFAEDYEDDVYPTNRPTGDSSARYGAGLMPDGYAHKGAASPIFNYPYERTRSALETMRRREEWDPCHGLKMRYVNPVNGDFAMPTIGTFMQLLPAGFDAEPYRASDATVFSVVEGRGHVDIGGQRFDWRPRDIFIVPSWQRYRLAADADAVLFSFSDRPIQTKLGLWREQRGSD